MQLSTHRSNERVQLGRILALAVLSRDPFRVAANLVRQILGAEPITALTAVVPESAEVAGQGHQFAEIARPMMQAEPLDEAGRNVACADGGTGVARGRAQSGKKEKRNVHATLAQWR